MVLYAILTPSKIPGGGRGFENKECNNTFQLQLVVCLICVQGQGEGEGEGEGKTREAGSLSRNTDTIPSYNVQSLLDYF